MSSLSDISARLQLRTVCSQFKCSNCGEEGDKYNRLELREKFDVPGGRGQANLVVKCKLCARVNSAGLSVKPVCITTDHPDIILFSIDIVPASTTAYMQQDGDSFKTLVVLECRGIEPIDCFLGDHFTVVSEAGTRFSDVSLEEGEWVEYDVKSNSSVGILSVSHQFIKV